MGNSPSFRQIPKCFGRVWCLKKYIIWFSNLPLSKTLKVWYINCTWVDNPNQPHTIKLKEPVYWVAYKHAPESLRGLNSHSWPYQYLSWLVHSSQVYTVCENMFFSYSMCHFFSTVDVLNVRHSIIWMGTSYCTSMLSGMQPDNILACRIKQALN